MERSVFFVSDGTGITAESFGQSLLAQFSGPQFIHHTLPYIDTPEKAIKALTLIKETHQQEQVQPIIFMTVLNEEVSTLLYTSGAYMIDLFATFLPGLENELGSHPLYTVGKKRSTTTSDSYHRRIEAVQFALDNDDGARFRHYEKADIILVGASRSGKTPTCIYLGLQFGLFAANYPITEDDFNKGIKLPESLRPHKGRLFGLTINPGRLAGIRNERRPNSQYSSLRQCQYDVQMVEQIYQQERIPYIDTTEFSVEEIATRIMDQANLTRRLK
ncbi:pyruvate, water dikinase regulatory protein [uncultured Endozoicomonas sp.]|uniref:posphoenolpyruvate synthetase regulatory kinase/phosphorylase PpsR n=1 Tax=uncultured Endozoicomonas sp. TaxID=432652 RepID=UPI00260EDEB9|nr:pyruvate, water dikinase regulatory protein [uncultured Endozoicomonas sp.]